MAAALNAASATGVCRPDRLLPPRYWRGPPTEGNGGGHVRPRPLQPMHPSRNHLPCVPSAHYRMACSPLPPATLRTQTPHPYVSLGAPWRSSQPRRGRWHRRRARRTSKRGVHAKSAGPCTVSSVVICETKIALQPCSKVYTILLASLDPIKNRAHTSQCTQTRYGISGTRQAVAHHRAFVCKAERWASYSCCMTSATLELSRT